MEINNSDFGGFIVSKNVLAGIPVRYAFREKSTIPEFNGWNVWSDQDDDEYMNDSSNFEAVSATTLFSIVPVMLELFNADYGTDLGWIYKQGVHIGFVDLKTNKETTIEEIVGE